MKIYIKRIVGCLEVVYTPVSGWLHKSSEPKENKSISHYPSAPSPESFHHRAHSFEGLRRNPAP